MKQPMIDVATANPTQQLLTERERDIVVRRFGLITGYYETLDEIGTGYGISRERVRQIERRALEKLGLGEQRPSVRDVRAAMARITPDT